MFRCFMEFFVLKPARDRLRGVRLDLAKAPPEASFEVPKRHLPKETPRDPCLGFRVYGLGPELRKTTFRSFFWQGSLKGSVGELRGM